MNEPQRTVQTQKEVPPATESSGDEKHPAQEPVGDSDGMQAGAGAAAAPAPDLDDPDEHAKDDDATDAPNT